MAPTPKSPPAKQRTRRLLLDLLKREGPRDSAALSAELGVSAMAVRQHLYDLARQKLVEFEQEPRPIGRPAKLWRLTQAADELFPDVHAELVVSLIDSMNRAFGGEGMDRLLAARAREQIKDYRSRLPTEGSLGKRVKALAAIRGAEGYMAEVQKAPGGSFLLIENHCPICVAATQCQGLCAMELDVFRSALGPRVEVERTEHIQAGERRCVYRIGPKRRKAKKR